MQVGNCQNGTKGQTISGSQNNSDIKCQFQSENANRRTMNWPSSRNKISNWSSSLSTAVPTWEVMSQQSVTIKLFCSPLSTLIPTIQMIHTFTPLESTLSKCQLVCEDHQRKKHTQTNKSHKVHIKKECINCLITYTYILVHNFIKDCELSVIYLSWC